MRTFIVLFLALGIAVSVTADGDNPPGIQSLMAPEDFTASGLDKLSEAERAHLSAWVARYREGAIKGPPVPGKERKEAAALAAQQEEMASAAETDQESGQQTTDEYPGGYKTEKERKKEKKNKKKFEMVAKVIPAFRGWRGKTVFVLDNGQVWRQRTAGSLRYSGADSTVIITQNLLGKFVMKHQGTGRSVGVRRID